MASAVELVRAGGLWAGTPYVDAAVVPPGARLIVLAGACPLGEHGATIGAGDLDAQTRACLATMTAALGAAGATLSDVVSTRVLVATTDRADLAAVWDVVHETFAAREVPSTLHGVTVLGWPDQLVEIEAIAAVLDGPDPGAHGARAAAACR